MSITAEDFARLAKQATVELAAEKEAAQLAAPAPAATPVSAVPGSAEDRQASILAQAAAITSAAETEAQLAEAARLVLSQNHAWASELDDDLALEAVGLGPVDPAQAAAEARAAIRADPTHELRTKWFSLSEGQRRDAAAAAGVDFDIFHAERMAYGRIFG